jgi:Domain of unknown function (DUF222)
MGIDEAVRLVRHVDAVRHAPTDLASITAATGEVTRLRAWLDGCEADLAAAFVGRSAMPTRDLAAARRTSERAADKVIERADTASSIPELGAAMAAGDVSGQHLDAVTAAVKSLEPAHRSAMRERAGQLAAKASTSTVEEFQALMRAEARRIMEDDGVARLQRQKRACRLRTWVSREDGMWRVSGSFDPETGLKLSGRLDNAVAALFAEATPESAPTDPGERADHLRALALVALTEGRAGSSGRSEIIAVVHEYEPQPSSNATDREEAPRVNHAPANDRSGARRNAPGNSSASAGNSTPGASNPPGRSHPAGGNSTPSAHPAGGNSTPSAHPAGGNSTSSASPPRRDNTSASSSAPAGSESAHADDRTFACDGAPVRFGSPLSDSGQNSEDRVADRHEARRDGHAGSRPLKDRSRSAPHVDWGLPVELPWEVLTRMIASGEADVHAVVVRNGIVIHTPGQLDLGRTTRLASKAQRRALRVMYPTCAVPGCCVRFQYTNAHHVIWWEWGGLTDIGNLLPLCSRHHHLVHEGGWHLSLDGQRVLTITLPDGTQLSNAPPHHQQKAAA